MGDGFRSELPRYYSTTHDKYGKEYHKEITLGEQNIYMVVVTRDIFQRFLGNLFDKRDFFKTKKVFIIPYSKLTEKIIENLQEVNGGYHLKRDIEARMQISKTIQTDSLQETINGDGERYTHPDGTSRLYRAVDSLDLNIVKDLLLKKANPTLRSFIYGQKTPYMLIISKLAKLKEEKARVKQTMEKEEENLISPGRSLSKIEKDIEIAKEILRLFNDLRNKTKHQ